jgi:cob(I)alamin adenosyltransferase
MPASAKEKLELINKGMEMVQKHSVPSPETKEALEEIKTRCASRGTDLALMQQHQNTMGEKVDKIEAKVDKFDEKLDTLIDKMSEKYASKWVESALKWAGAIAGAAIITALMRLIFK